jgi:hypothetical protein
MESPQVQAAGTQLPQNKWLWLIPVAFVVLVSVGISFPRRFTREAPRPSKDAAGALLLDSECGIECHSESGLILASTELSPAGLLDR